MGRSFGLFSSPAVPFIDRSLYVGYSRIPGNRAATSSSANDHRPRVRLLATLQSWMTFRPRCTAYLRHFVSARPNVLSAGAMASSWRGRFLIAFTLESPQIAGLRHRVIALVLRENAFPPQSPDAPTALRMFLRSARDSLILSASNLNPNAMRSARVFQATSPSRLWYHRFTSAIGRASIDPGGKES